MIQLLGRVTSSPHDADVKGDTFRTIIYLPNIIVVASSSWSYGGRRPSPPPAPVVEDRKRPGLNKINLNLNVIFSQFP